MIKLLLLLAPVIFLTVGCGGECATDQEYTARFTLLDQQTGKPYYQDGVAGRSIDSLRIYTSSNSRQPLPLDRVVSSDGTMSFGYLDLWNVPEATYYIRFNQADTDTLVLTSQLTPIPNRDQCLLYRHLTTVYYNNRFIQKVSSDTTGFFTIQLRK